MNANSTRTARHTTERTPNPLLGALFCLAVLVGGGIAGHTWAADTCATPAAASVTVVCDAIG